MGQWKGLHSDKLRAPWRRELLEAIACLRVPQLVREEGQIYKTNKPSIMIILQLSNAIQAKYTDWPLVIPAVYQGSYSTHLCVCVCTHMQSAVTGEDVVHAL